MTQPALFLTEADIATLVDVGEAIECLEEAFGRWGADDIVNLPRQRARPPQGVLNLMGAVDGGLGVYGIKSYFPSRHSPQPGFYVALHSMAEGRLLALMQAQLMSQVRTGAASGLATRYMARPEASVLGMIGTGRQAFAQAAAICAVRPISSLRVFGRDAAKRAAFAARLEGELNVEARPVETAQAAVADADIVVTITSSATPVLDGAWLKPGTHVNAAGGNVGNHFEIDETTILRADRLVTDDGAQARIEAAEFMALANSGRLDWMNVTDLAELVQGKSFGRTSERDITFFKSLGIAFEDVAYAYRLYEKAVQKGLGQTLG